MQNFSNIQLPAPIPAPPASPAPPPPVPVPDQAMASSFLGLLDPSTTSFTFQTFSDNSDTPNRTLARIYHGSLADHWESLFFANSQGAGIFVTVNETNLRGRTKNDIVRVRCIFQEDDDGSSISPPLEPNITVESSPGKFHRYILIDGCPLEDFQPLQQTMVDKFGSDKSAKDLARVLRVPGFLHQKVNAAKGLTGTPHLVRLDSACIPAPYPFEAVRNAILGTVDAVMAGFDKFVESVAYEPKTLNPDAPAEDKARVVSALTNIDPDESYDEWLNILMSLHDWSGGSKVGFDIADEWSRRGTGYTPGCVEEKWESFSLNQGVTIASLYKRAKESGWDQKIEVTPENIIAVEEQVRSDLEQFDKTHACVLVDGKAYILYITKDGMGRQTTALASQGQLVAHYQNRFVEVLSDNGEKVMKKPLVPYWLTSHSRRTYSDIVFEPRADMRATTDDLPDTNVYNRYQGLTVDPQPGDCSLINQHIFKTWCCGDMIKYMYVIQWLARMYQYPGKQAETCLVLFSGEGAGKNIVVDPLVNSFGVNGSICTNPNELTGVFNMRLNSSILVVLNEAVWGGNHRASAALKALITDSSLSVQEKFQPTMTIKNCAHLIVMSNSDWIVPIGVDDRRFFVLELDESVKQDRAYFEPLAEEIGNGGVEAFIHQLLNMDISGFKPNKMPKVTSAKKQDNQIRTANNVIKWLDDLLFEGDLPGPHAGSWETDELSVRFSFLYDHYEQWAVRRKEKLESQKMVSASLVKYLELEDRKRRDSRGMVYRFPVLEECREIFHSQFS